MTKETNFKPVTRTSAGLRDALFDELDGLRDGSVNATKANATAKIAGAIVDTVTMEMTAYKLMNKSGGASIQGKVPTLALGE